MGLACVCDCEFDRSVPVGVVGGLTVVEAVLWGRSDGEALYEGCRRDELRATDGVAVDAADIIAVGEQFRWPVVQAERS